MPGAPKPHSQASSLDTTTLGPGGYLELLPPPRSFTGVLGLDP
jgi:hypothetical protein